MKLNRQLFIVLVLVLSACNLPGGAVDTSGQTDSSTQPAPTVPPAVSPTVISTEIPFQPTLAVVGPEEIVFDWSYDSCDPEDIPDLPARAFRDVDGQVHLIAAHIRSRANVGLDLNHLTHQCDILMNSDHDDDPSHFNDNEWIAAPFTEDGETVYAVVHDEYHGWEHNDCNSTTVDFGCWYNTLTLAVSHDGGQTFEDAAPPPDHFVAGLPYSYEAGAGPYGTLEPSNILKAKDGYYYQVARVDDYKSTNQWLCLNRTDNLSDPTSWRAWDGTGFNMQYISPYKEPDADPSKHLCEPLSPDETGLMSQSLTYNTVLDRYVLLGLSADHINGREVWGIYYAFSEDLIHWTHRQLLWERELNWTFQPGDEQPIGYPTLIDPDSPSMSFDSTDNQLYLYYTKFNAGSPLDRDIVRVPVEFFETQAEAQAADTRTKLDLQPATVTDGNVTFSGKLTTTFGTPLSGETIDLFATQNSGNGDYFEYQLSGKIPTDATRAILGYRNHIECDCTDTDSEFWLYNMNFEMGNSGVNLIPNPTFANGVSGANLWNGGNLAKVETSDRNDGNMLHIRAEAGQTSAGDLASFSVKGGETYTATFGARVPPASNRTGFFVLVFLNNSGELVRYPIYFDAPALPVGSAETDADGNFMVTWSTPVNTNSIQVIFSGDERFLQSKAVSYITLP